MKTPLLRPIQSRFTLLLLFAGTLLITCEKIDRDNPWDAKADLDPNNWAPQNLEIELISITERKLIWYYGDHNIEGFKIDRKEGDGEWKEAFVTLGNDARSWNDTEILPFASLTYSYRVYAYAGDNGSFKQPITVSAAITPPSELKLDKHPETDIAYKLSWNDNSKGEEGFKIDRRTGDGDWIVPFDSVPKNHTEYLDTNVFAGKSTMDLHYRVYAYYRQFESEKVSTETEAFLPAPTNLEITINSISSVSLSWQDNSTGEEGFKIDRKTGDDDWQIGYASVSANETSYIDNDVDLVENQYLYRIYAYYGVYNSNYDEAEYLPLEVSTKQITNISFFSAISGGYVVGSHIDSRGIAYGTSSNPDIFGNTVPAESGAGSFTVEMTNLTPETEYYVRAYSTNNADTVYGNEVMFKTAPTYDDDTEVVDVLNPATGKTWMDRNLGASRAAISSTDEEAYGDLYQWGRATDGHQKRNSGTTSTLSSTDFPGHGNFITVNSSPYDWRSPQSDTLWQGVNGVNNPCPPGYRLPTFAELDAERQSWSSYDATGAFASPLKLPMAGFRWGNDGSLEGVGYSGRYWSSTVHGSLSWYLIFFTESYSSVASSRAQGHSVRCIKN